MMNTQNTILVSAPTGLKKRGTALAIALLMILAAVFGIGGAKLRIKGSGVTAAFTKGKGEIDSHFSQRLDIGYNLLTLADTMPELAEQAGVSSLADALDAAKKAEGPAGRYAADQALTAAVEEFETTFQSAGLPAEKENLMYGQLADLNSSGQILRGEVAKYNQKAEQFNRLLDSFPASLLARLWGVKEAELCK